MGCGTGPVAFSGCCPPVGYGTGPVGPAGGTALGTWPGGGPCGDMPPIGTPTIGTGPVGAAAGRRGASEIWPTSAPWATTSLGSFRVAGGRPSSSVIRRWTSRRCDEPPVRYIARSCCGWMPACRSVLVVSTMAWSMSALISASNSPAVMVTMDCSEPSATGIRADS